MPWVESTRQFPLMAIIFSKDPYLKIWSEDSGNPYRLSLNAKVQRFLIGSALISTLCLLYATTFRHSKNTDTSIVSRPYFPNNEGAAVELFPVFYPPPSKGVLQVNELDPNDINPTMPAKIRKALVLSTFSHQDNSWVDELGKISPGWEVFRYATNRDDSMDSDVKELKGDLGREALAYLTYLSENYDDLPDYTIFNHGHNRAWHQPMSIVDKISALNYSALSEEHFINLRCNESPGCTADTKYYYDNPKEGDNRWGYHLEKFWNDRMRPQIGRMPRTIGTRCCAQFAVDKAAILDRPQIFYERLREPLISKNITAVLQVWGEDIPEERLGTMYEMVWQIIFGKPADHCPSTDYCQKVYFQDKIHCDREINVYADSAGWDNIKCTNDLRKDL